MPSWQARVLKAYLRVQRLFSRPRDELDVQKERSELEALAGMFKPLSAIQCSPLVMSGVPAEWIVPSNLSTDRVLLYLHGGSYNAGSINSHRSLAANIAAAANARALIIDYRLAPEHPYPAAVDDATAAYEWLLDNGHAPGEIIIAGDSAGGGLALALLVHLRDKGKPLPALAICLSPWTDLAGAGESLQTRAKADIILDAGNLSKSAQAYLGGADPRAPLASPLYADLKGLPPLLIQVGSDEILLSDSTELAERAKGAGVNVTLEVWEPMQHDWHFAASFVPEGRQAIARIGEFVEQSMTR
jgi:monoterpene epsilon-lactone hydrolase